MTSQRQPRRRRPAKAKRRSSQDTNGREGRTVAEGSRQEGASRSATSSTKAAGTEINNGGSQPLGFLPRPQAVNQAGYSQPTPVQSGVIPRAIAGIDVLGQADGNGKNRFVRASNTRVAHTEFRTGSRRACTCSGTHT